MFPQKCLVRDGFETVEAFAQARADGFRIQFQSAAQLLVAQVPEVSQLDDFAARFPELIHCGAHQCHLLRAHQVFVGSGRAAGRVRRQTGGWILGLQGNGGLPGAAFGGKTIIEKGVAPGETVVTDGHLMLFPGARVKLVDAAKVGAGPL